MMRIEAIMVTKMLQICLASVCLVTVGCVSFISHKKSFDKNTEEVPVYWGNVSAAVMGARVEPEEDRVRLLPFGPGLYIHYAEHDNDPKVTSLDSVSHSRGTNTLVRFCVWNGLSKPIFLRSGGCLAHSIERRIRSTDILAEIREPGNWHERAVFPELSDSVADDHFVLLNGTRERIPLAFDAYRFGQFPLASFVCAPSWTGTFSVVFEVDGYFMGGGQRFQGAMKKDFPVTPVDDSVSERMDTTAEIQ